MVLKYNENARLLATVEGFGGEAYVVATGLTRPSANRKVGPSVQIWILPVEMLTNKFSQQHVCKLGETGTGCSLLPKEVGGQGGCYVAKMPLYNLVKACKEKRVPIWNGETEIFRNKFVRFGAWGEPVLIPLTIVERLIGVASGHTGYTHLWGLREYQAYRNYYMASVHTPQDAQRAHSMGWRYFSSSRQLIDPQQFPTKTVQCPYDSSGLQCVDCRLCGGTATKQVYSIQIAAHGTRAVMRGSRFWNPEIQPIV
jgi:hypothetical protein